MRPHVLPVALTPLLGRERALEETARLLDGARLLTITGAGGSGKTRLALELAHRSTTKFDRVVWVDLAAIDEGSLIAQAILEAMGVRESPTFHDAEVVVESLRGKRHLIALDNCEHVVDACAALVEKILRSSPETKIVTTTREPLGIAGEQTWLVPPLASPDAIELFAERARSASPSFALTDANRETVEHICARLDGIPLPIELAAARVRVLSVEQISSRLDDAFSLLTSGSRTLTRHRTIRETIDWSYRLLSNEEQVLLQRLSVFAGSFSLSAAETVCACEDVLHTLGALVDKSLVVAGGGRYRLLETVRQFAAEKLAASGDVDAVRARHAKFYTDLVERSERRIYAGAVDLDAMAMIDEEIDNIRRAFEWTEESPERAETELRLLWAIHWYWFARGHFHEARRRLVRGIARAAGVDAVVRARAIVAGGNAAVWQGDWTALRPSIDEAIDVLRPTSNLRALANALILLGSAMTFAEGDHAAAKRVFDEAEVVARENGRNVALALTLYWSGIGAVWRNDAESARRAFEEALQIGTEQRNLPAIGHAATMLALADVQQKRFNDAIAHLRVAIDAHGLTGDRWGMTQAVECVGLLLLEIGDPEQGTRLLAGASAAWLQLGARPGRTEEFERGRDARIAQALGNDRLRVALASGTAMSYDDMLALARAELAKIGAGATPSVIAAPQLRVNALGRGLIEAGGRTVNAGSSAQELLLFLLTTPSGATKEAIGAAMWPDADPAKLRNNFHVTLHRLRKLLGDPGWVTTENDVYALDRSRGIEFDAESFERAVKAALKTGDVNALDTALQMYGGDFAPQLASEWAVPLRSRLRDLFGEALRVAGRARVSSGDFRAAAEIYTRLVELDDLDEQSSRNLMNALARSGDVGGADRVYRRLVDTLQRELQTVPDPATVRLHERITS